MTCSVASLLGGVTPIIPMILTGIASLATSTPVARGLQPGLRRGGALLPACDLRHVLEREPDVVEAFKEPHAVGRRNLEGNIAAARPADALGLEIDGEWRGAIGGADPRRGPLRGVGRQH